MVATKSQSWAAALPHPGTKEGRREEDEERLGCRWVRPHREDGAAELCRGIPVPGGHMFDSLVGPELDVGPHWGHCWPPTKPGAVGLLAGQLGFPVAGPELRVQVRWPRPRSA